MLIRFNSCVSLRQVLGAEEEKAYIKNLNKEKFNFIIQEYIPHEELYTLPDILLPLIEQKNLGIYHGDIKPNNIRFDPLRNACVFIDYDQSIFLTEAGKNAGINSFLVFCDAYDKKKYQQGEWLRHFKEFKNEDLHQYLNGSGLVHNPHFSSLKPQRIGDNAIKKICTTLEDKGIKLSSLKALDFFAREGDWQTQYYANKVKQVHAWEIDRRFEKKLRHNLPQNSKITIGNSFELILECDEKFDLVSIDNPQGVFGDEKQYCEHFEALPLIIRVLKKKSIIIFNVKTRPYNYLTQKDWQKKRNRFYKLEDCSNIEESFIKLFYEKLLSSYGYLTKYSFLNSRLQENNLFALTMVIEKNEQSPLN